MGTQLRKQRTASSEDPTPDEITSWPLPPHNARKRYRSPEDDESYDVRDTSRKSSSDEQHQDQHNNDNDTQSPPSTPKRSHIAPLELPLGTQPSDFHDQYTPTEEEKRKQGTQIETERDGQQWSIEDDHVLVEVILGKLDLSHSDWERCARSMGRDRECVERRWISLMGNHAVGLKSSKARRGKNYDAKTVGQHFGLSRSTGFRERVRCRTLE